MHCRTALTQAGGEGPTGGGVEGLRMQMAERLGFSGRREGLRFHRRGNGVSRRLRRGGGGGARYGKALGGAPVSKTRCLGSREGN